MREGGVPCGTPLEECKGQRALFSMVDTHWDQQPCLRTADNQYKKRIRIRHLESPGLFLFAHFRLSSYVHNCHRMEQQSALPHTQRERDGELREPENTKQVRPKLLVPAVEPNHGER